MTANPSAQPRFLPLVYLSRASVEVCSSASISTQSSEKRAPVLCVLVLGGQRLQSVVPTTSWYMPTGHG